MLRYCGVEILAASDYMIAVAHRAVTVDQLTEKTLAFFERERARVETIEAEQVENVVVDRDGQAQAGDRARIVDVHSSLKKLKTRASAIVGCDDLAVENEPVERDRVQREHDLGISISNIGALARVQMSILAFANSQYAHAIVLYFE